MQINKCGMHELSVAKGTYWLALIGCASESSTVEPVDDYGTVELEIGSVVS